MEWNGEGGNPFYHVLTYLPIFLPLQIGGMEWNVNCCVTFVYKITVLSSQLLLKFYSIISLEWNITLSYFISFYYLSSIQIYPLMYRVQLKSGYYACDYYNIIIVFCLIVSFCLEEVPKVLLCAMNQRHFQIRDYKNTCQKLCLIQCGISEHTWTVLSPRIKQSLYERVNRFVFVRPTELLILKLQKMIMSGCYKSFSTNVNIVFSFGV